jgi:hypothetical protein
MQKAKTLRDEYTRTIEPARARSAETLKLEPALSDFADHTCGLTPAERFRCGADLWSVVVRQSGRLSGRGRKCWPTTGRSR